MATHKSAEKAIRQTVKRTAINKSRINRVKTFVRKVEDLIKSNQPQEARVSLVKAERELMRAASKHVIHKNKASRKVSRLSKRIASLG